MYKSYFGLTHNPFEVTPDPSFLFRTPGQNEAMAAIYFGIIRNKGFIVLTGEVGTGKTLALRCVARMLVPNDVAFAFVFNPLLTPLQFLQTIVADLGLPPHDSKQELLHSLNTFLISRYRKGLTAALMIDEAQLLSPELLEEIRLLTNLETDRKLLQIVLAGQPELEDILDSAPMRQVKQRVALRCTLRPLNEEQTTEYITYRLSRAGADSRSDKLFPPAAIEGVYRYSKGIPRLINTVCENALLGAYALQQPFVTSDIIEEVASDLRLCRETQLAQNAPTSHPSALDSLVSFLESLKRTQAPARESDRARGHVI